MPLYCHRSLPEVKSALAADIACVTYGRYLRDGTLEHGLRQQTSDPCKSRSAATCYAAPMLPVDVIEKPFKA